jgi:hypothetical protein
MQKVGERTKNYVLTRKLDFIRVHSISKYVVIAVPEIDLVVVCSSSNKLNVSHLNIVCRYNRSSRTSVFLYKE